MYLAAADVLRERSDWERLADELLADNVADGAVYVELIFDALPHIGRFGGEADGWAMLFDVFDAASKRHSLPVGWMTGIDRVERGPQAALALAEFAVAQRSRGMVSFGLHNIEVAHPPSDFVEPMRVAREGGLQITPHVGELDSGANVALALDVLEPTRILHGVRSVEVPGLIDRLAAAGICLDVCPTSNVAVGPYDRYAAYPLPILLDAGVRCSVNADDPLLFGSTLLGEYEVCRREFGFDDDRLAAIARTSIEAAFLPASVKAAALAGIDTSLTSQVSLSDALDGREILAVMEQTVVQESAAHPRDPVVLKTDWYRASTFHCVQQRWKIRGSFLPSFR